VTDTTFKAISVHSWRQFRSVDVEFAHRVTILTGRNGTGKTTLLNILAHHSQYHSTFLASPVQTRDSLGRFTSGVWNWEEDTEATDVIGNISYSSGETSEIRVQRKVAVNFSPKLSPQVAVSVLNIPSHRRLPAYKKVESIPTVPITRETALESYQREFWSGVRGEMTRTTPLTKMKEALISMAAFGPGNNRVVPNHESDSAIRDFESRLREIIPKNIGFRRLVVQIPDVIVETDSGRFLLDASSGGLMSLIDITWQITLFGRDKQRFVVVIDEPENHLHPSMQREFLPALVSAFPECQFVVATHSPFVVSSVKESAVYAFDVADQHFRGSSIAEDLSASTNAVITKRVDISDRARSSEILRDVLGVPISVPIWAEQELDEILSKFSDADFSSQDIQAIHRELNQRGLSDFLPDIIARAAGRNAKD